LLARHGSIRIDKTDPGRDYRRRGDAAQIVKLVLSELGSNDTDFIVGSANGTFVDQAEVEALSQLASDKLTYTVKPALGESVGASALWQVIVAVQALRTGELPPLLHAPAQPPIRIAAERRRLARARRAVAVTCGLNQQVAGLALKAEN
jgi:3-oxoacyl-(acyl-carrier-protein) synthase